MTLKPPLPPNLPASIGSGFLTVLASAYLLPSGGDDSAAVSAALTTYAPFAHPHIVLGPGTFLWNSTVPSLARSAPATIAGAGPDNTTIKLSASAPRAFDLTKVADYDTFQSIELSGFTVDQNNVGGAHHIILGNVRAGVTQSRLNFDRIHVHDIRVINAPVDPTLATARLHALHFSLLTTASSEATQITATNMLFERIDVSGAGVGIYVGGSASVSPTTSTPNAYIDNITINDLRHDLGALQNTNFASCHIQIGQNALVGTININRLRGFNSGDVGVELDNIRDGYINDSHVTDANGYSFFKTNFNTTANSNGQGKDWSVNAQFMRFIDCRAVRQNLVNTTSSTSRGRLFVINDSGNNLQIGTVIFERCSGHATAADTNKTTLGEFIFLAGLVARVIVSDCEATVENIANASGTNNYAMFYTSLSGNQATMLTVRGLRLRASGSIAAGTLNFYGMQLNQSTANLDLNFDIDAPEFDIALTTSGGTIGNLIGIDLGRVLLRASGSISNWRAPNFGTFAGRIGINVESTTTFACRGLMIDQPDFTNAGTEVNLGGSGATSNASKVIVDTIIRWDNNNALRSPAGRFPTAASMTMKTFDRVVAVTSTAAARTITLPFVAAAPPGQVYTVKDESNAAATNNISVTAQTGEFWEDGVTATRLINTNLGRISFYSNGTRWQQV